MIKSFEKYTCKLRSTLCTGPVLCTVDEAESSAKFHLKLPYCDNMSNSIAKSISRGFNRSSNSELRISFKCCKVGSFFRVKDRIPDLRNSGCIYHISCGDQACGDNYIGESKLRLCDRFKKHVNADYFKEFSSIHDHCKTASHKLPDQSHLKVLHVESAWYRRKIMESLFIKDLQPTLNRNVQSYNLQLF